jgi:hypothetical protein
MASLDFDIYIDLISYLFLDGFASIYISMKETDCESWLGGSISAPKRCSVQDFADDPSDLPVQIPP